MILDSVKKSSYSKTSVHKILFGHVQILETRCSYTVKLRKTKTKKSTLKQKNLETPSKIFLRAKKSSGHSLGRGGGNHDWPSHNTEILFSRTLFFQKLLKLAQISLKLHLFSVCTYVCVSGGMKC